jgi:hypothetical protein
MAKIISSFKFRHTCSSQAKTAFLLLVLLAELLIAGNITPVGPEFQVNTSMYWSQYNPAIASDNNGNFVITWTGLDIETPGSESSGVFAQRFSSTGQRLGGEFRVNTTISGHQEHSRIAMDQAGNFVVTWNKNVSGDIFAQRYNASGIAQGSEFLVNSTTEGEQFPYPEIAMDANGNFVICWIRDDGYGESLYAKRFAANGVVLNNEFRVDTLEHYFVYGTVSMSDSGAFVIVLSDWASSSSNEGIFARLYNSSGIAQGNEFKINSSSIRFGGGQVRMQLI